MLTNETYTNKIDMWGLGVILHELLTTELPFFSGTSWEYKQNIVNGQIRLDDEKLWEDTSS